MAIIRKKSAGRAEGGQRFLCDVCSADITATVRFLSVADANELLIAYQVRIHCAHSSCVNYDVCVTCFAAGSRSHAHDPATHPYNVIEQNSVPIYDAEWGADEELLLLEGAETYGLGSWVDIAEHIGGYRDKDEVRDHYTKVYLESPNFPLPTRSSIHDTDLMDSIPREEFQARKKRRIEERKLAHDNAPAAAPKTKPTSSVPSCHEVAGYMPGRLEFETEHYNEAEEAVQHMQFDPGDGINPRTGEVEPEMELKLTVMSIYNSRLTARADRKKVIFEHNLLEYKKNTAADKKRTKDERDLLIKTKPFARMMNHDDYEDLCLGLLEEHAYRQAVSQLQDWRSIKVSDLHAGEKYESDRATRLQKQQPMGSMDREASYKALPRSGSKANSANIAAETPHGAALLIAPELDTSSPALATPGKSNGMQHRQPLMERSPTPQLPALGHIQPLSFTQENVGDLQLLTRAETDLCEKLRMYPKAYLCVKDAILREAVKNGGTVRKRAVKEILGSGIDSQKCTGIWEFFGNRGWIGKG